LRNRIVQHKYKFYPRTFTAKYNADELVYYEAFFDIGEAIAREKQLKRLFASKEAGFDKCIQS